MLRRCTGAKFIRRPTRRASQTVRRGTAKYAARLSYMSCSRIAHLFCLPNAAQNALSRVKILRLAAARMRIIKSRAALKFYSLPHTEATRRKKRLCDARRTMFRARAAQRIQMLPRYASHGAATISALGGKFIKFFKFKRRLACDG